MKEFFYTTIIAAMIAVPAYCTCSLAYDMITGILEIL